FHRGLEESSDARLFGHLPPVTDVTTAAFPKENVIFLACDAAYFGAFGAPMLRSLAERGPGEQVHVHIMDANDTDLASIRNFCTGLRALAIGITAEQTGQRAIGVQAAREYYHAIRFVRYHQIL